MALSAILLSASTPPLCLATFAATRLMIDYNEQVAERK
jgi:hypothetical protein